MVDGGGNMTITANYVGFPAFRLGVISFFVGKEVRLVFFLCFWPCASGEGVYGRDWHAVLGWWGIVKKRALTEDRKLPVQGESTQSIKNRKNHA